MGQYRMQRLGVQLRDEIAQLIMRGDVKDPRVSTFLTINRVEVSRDLSYAKAYVSSFLPDAQLEHGVAGLNSAAGFIQSSIAKKLRVRQFPKIAFVVDASMKQGFDMIKKLTALEQAEQTSSDDERLPHSEQ
ncbi:MAG: 30S ribosome-binding factor RbfA [Treponema sp.]|nr:30S ribosome-binding factor RbfA [Treponema sp.]